MVGTKHRLNEWTRGHKLLGMGYGFLGWRMVTQNYDVCTGTPHTKSTYKRAHAREHTPTLGTPGALGRGQPLGGCSV